jgi:hypothetical protein
MIEEGSMSFAVHNSSLIAGDRFCKLHHFGDNSGTRIFDCLLPLAFRSANLLRMLFFMTVRGLFELGPRSFPDAHHSRRLGFQARLKFFARAVFRKTFFRVHLSSRFAI